MSFFSCDPLPDDPILSLSHAFYNETHPNKVNLGVGAYKDQDGYPYIFEAVRKVEKSLASSSQDKEYLPIEGDREFINKSLQIVFGKNFSHNLFAAQTIGASGGLRIGAELLHSLGYRQVYLSDPTWPNHRGIFNQVGFEINTYPYYNFKNNCLDFSSLSESLKKIPQKACILLQPCCHNPTGTDPTHEQWSEIQKIIQERKILPFFDLAYQGLKEGLDEDAKVIRLFAEEGMEILVTNSFSKNLGLYGERIGMLSILTHSHEAATNLGSHLKQLIRANYSTPPLHGARIVKRILESPSIYEEWIGELKVIRKRVQNMRQGLVKLLSERCQDRDFRYLEQQNGLFSYTGLTAMQVTKLKEEWGIYLPSSGRINVAGLNEKNIEYVTDAISKVL